MNYHEKLVVQAGGSVRLAFEGVIGNNYRGDIGLDDIVISKTLCPVPRESFYTWTDHQF